MIVRLWTRSVGDAAALLLAGIGVGLIALARHLTHDDDGLADLDDDVDAEC